MGSSIARDRIIIPIAESKIREPPKGFLMNRLKKRSWRHFALVALIIASHSAIAATQHPPKRAQSLRLYVFDCGTIDGLTPEMFNLKAEEVTDMKLAVPCYLIVHRKGTLMWDTGVIPDGAFGPAGVPVTQGVSMATKPLLPQLAQIGYAPKDIDYLALSHYHLDHAANANAFAAATWLVQKSERDAMFANPPPRLARPEDYRALKSSKTIVIKAPRFDVFGDGAVLILAAPGHTEGHQVLYLNLAKTGPIIIAGDLYHYPEERTLDRVPAFEYNADESRASRKAIEAFAAETHAQIWIEHNYASNIKLKKSPLFYD
jgi:N-acyl homoserine lactone hydrolase